jgi:hypothetical protein
MPLPFELYYGGVLHNSYTYRSVQLSLVIPIDSSYDWQGPSGTPWHGNGLTRCSPFISSIPKELVHLIRPL